MARLSTKMASQKARLLEHMQLHGAITTIGTRQDMGVMHPAARIQELRERGYKILTAWDIEDSDDGKHRVVGYDYLSSILSGRSVIASQ